jgi:hypothetical protein
MTLTCNYCQHETQSYDSTPYNPICAICRRPVGKPAQVHSGIVKRKVLMHRKGRSQFPYWAYPAIPIVYAGEPSFVPIEETSVHSQIYL